MKEDKQPYTRITIESYYPVEDAYEKATVEKNRWDCDIGEFHNMWRQALAGFSFSTKLIDKFYGDNP